MQEFLIDLWPYLFGALVGWTLCGLQARHLKYAERRERLIEVPRYSPPSEPPPPPVQAQAVTLLTTPQSVELDLKAARSAGLKLKSADDFTVIEGVGPKIRQLLLDAGILSFQQLSGTPVTKIQEILSAAGRAFALARPDSWPEQAALAAGNRWEELKALQGELDGGVKREVQ